MTTYNSYEAAKIANPEKTIYKIGDNFTESSELLGQPLQPCNPADHCVTVEKFLTDGYKFVEGDIYLNSDGRTLGVVNFPEYNNKRSTIDCNLYILRAAALENQMNIDKVETQTPEEKEALNSIKPVHLRDYQKNTQTEHQEEMSAFSGEWQCGDFAIYEGSVVMVIAYHPKHPVIVVEASTEEYINVGICDLSKPETPRQREDRERLEAAYDLYCTCGIQHETAGFDEWKDCYIDPWLAVVDKTNYRKGVK